MALLSRCRHRSSSEVYGQLYVYNTIKADLQSSTGDLELTTALRWKANFARCIMNKIRKADDLYKDKSTVEERNYSG